MLRRKDELCKQEYRRTQYVILTAFAREKWLRERASILRYSALPVLLRFS